MSEPLMPPGAFGEPGPGRDHRRRPRPAGGAALPAVTASLAVVAGTVLLSVAAGAGWAVAAPRPLLVTTGPGAAGLVNAETSAFIAADGSYCLICLAGGVVSGVLGYVLAVRRHGPLAMAAVVVGAVAAGYVTRWVGEQSGLAAFQHLLASLPAGRRLRGSLNLGSAGALAFWPLAASVAAGALAVISKPAGRHSVRDADGPPAGLRSPEGLEGPERPERTEGIKWAKLVEGLEEVESPEWLEWPEGVKGAERVGGAGVEAAERVGGAGVEAGERVGGAGVKAAERVGGAGVEGGRASGRGRSGRGPSEWAGPERWRGRRVEGRRAGPAGGARCSIDWAGAASYRPPRAPR